MNERYGKGNWKLPNKGYNKLKKWGERGFNIPEDRYPFDTLKKMSKE